MAGAGEQKRMRAGSLSGPAEAGQDQVYHPEQCPDGGALAGSVGADEASHHPGGEPPVNLFDGQLVAETFGQPELVIAQTGSNASVDDTVSPLSGTSTLRASTSVWKGSSTGG
jgi:hypothetical protein